jgi:hypothetical protein
VEISLLQSYVSVTVAGALLSLVLTPENQREPEMKRVAGGRWPFLAGPSMGCSAGAGLAFRSPTALGERVTSWASFDQESLMVWGEQGQDEQPRIVWLTGSTAHHFLRWLDEEKQQTKHETPTTGRCAHV